MTFGEGKSAKQAQRDTMNEFGPARLATGERWQGEVITKKIRVWADRQYRAQNVHWQETFAEPLELANVVLEPVIGVRLVAEYVEWDRHEPGATLTDDIQALGALDPGTDVFAVIGLTSSLPLVSSTFEQLGLAMINGRHIMVRGYADLEERKMYANAFPDLRADERELALTHLRHHKTAVVLLHELGHILGVEHESDADTIMHAAYSAKSTAFSASARAVMLRSADVRLGRGQAEHAPAVSAPVVAAPPKPAPGPVVAHAPVVIRVTRTKQTFVDGTELSRDAFEAELRAVFAQDPETKIVIQEDRKVPSGVVAAVLDQLKAIGFAKVEFSWSGR